MSGGPSRRSGLALIIVVGVLAVLAAIATAFVMMAELERKASQQRLLSTKAYLLSRSGIEDALARLAVGQDPDAAGNNYWGEDWDASGGVLSAFEAAQEVYRAGIPDTATCPLRHALHPSFFVNDGTGKPRYRPVDGRQRGYSGSLSGDFTGGDGNTYALKVDSPDGFFVNGGNPASPVAVGNYNETLRRILGTLAEAIDREDGADDGVPVDQLDGEALINARPLTAVGWLGFDQIRIGALGGNQAKLDALQPYLILKAWVDKKVVVSPSSRNETVGQQPYDWAELRYYTPRFETLVGTVGRAPVSLPWARSRRPALIALLAGLKGTYLDESTQLPGAVAASFTYDRIGTIQEAAIANIWSAADDCHVAADAIMTTPMDLTTWQSWNAFCDTIPFTAMSSSPEATADLRQAMRDVLKANFNPNTDMNKFNPNASLWRSSEKSDLSVYSTEFSLVPLQAAQIQGLGRVLSKSGRLLALRSLTARLAGPQMLRLTAQSEFVCENLGKPDIAGDETGARFPGFRESSAAGRSAFVSESRGAGVTWGHRLDTTVLGAGHAGGWMDGTSQGAGLQTYPEPCWDTMPNLAEAFPDPTAAKLSIVPVSFDGNLQLATLETATGDTYGVAGAMKSLARFDDAPDLDVSGAYPGNPDGKLAMEQAWPKSNEQFTVTTELNTKRILGWPGNGLFPDGLYSELRHAPSYFSKDNVSGFHGVISFWMKPNFDCSKMLAPSVTLHQRGHRFLRMTNVDFSIGSGKGGPTQVFQLFFCNTTVTVKALPLTSVCFAAFMETGHNDSDTKHEDLFCTPPRTNVPHRWYLWTTYYDFQAGTNHDVGDISIDAGTGAADATYGFPGDEQYSKGNDAAAAQDITADELSDWGVVVRTPHQITLGGGHDLGQDNLPGFFNGPYEHTGTGADSTLDEYAFYDFGQVPGSGKSLAGNRYKDGRYYKGWVYTNLADALAAPAVLQAASYFSAPITSLPAGATLRKICWTWIRPSDANLAQDYAEIALVKTDLSGYLWTELQSRSTKGPGWTTQRQDWDVGRILPGGFRIQAVFRRPPAGVTTDAGTGAPRIDVNTPILDSPVLDDVSLVYAPPGANLIVSWTEGE